MYLSAVVKSSYRLCQKLAEKLKSSEEDLVKLLGAAFSCALCAIESAQSIYKGEHGKEERAKVLNDLTLTLKSWIALREVIGGSVFGYSVPSYLTRSQLNWKGKQELKVTVANINNILFLHGVDASVVNLVSLFFSCAYTFR